MDEAWEAAAHEVAGVGHDWATEHVHKCLTDEEINT